MSKQIIKRKKAPKQKKTTKVTKTTIEKSVEKQELELFYEYNGKKYPPGAIIYIPRGMYFVKKSTETRKKKTSKVIPRESENDESPEYIGGEEKDDEEEEWNEYGDENRANEIEENEEEESGEEIEKPKARRRKPVKEKGITFIEKRVVVLEGEALEIAKEYGLDYAEFRIVGVPHEYEVSDYDIMYTGYDPYIVATKENVIGKTVTYLKPYSPGIEKKGGIIFDGDFMPPPVPKDMYIPEEKEKEMPPDNYKGDLRIGDRIEINVQKPSKTVKYPVISADDEKFEYVNDDGIVLSMKYADSINLEFVAMPQKKLKIKKGKPYVIVKKIPFPINTVNLSTNKSNTVAKKAVTAPYLSANFTMPEKITTIEGVIYGYEPEGFVVSHFRDGAIDLFDVKYNDPTIRKIERLGLKDISAVGLDKGMTPEEYLNNPLDKHIRNEATKQLFKMFAKIIPNVYESPDIDSNIDLEQLRKNINWSMVTSELKPFDVYYVEQFNSWLFSDKYPKLLAQAPDFIEESENEYNSSIDPILIIEALVYKFGNIFDGTASRCLSMMERAADHPEFQPTIIDIEIRKELTKIGDDDLENINGPILARTIATIITNTIKTFPPPSSKQIQARMRNDWAISKFNDYKPIKSEYSRFDKVNLTEVRNLYQNYEAEWNMTQTKLIEFQQLKSKLKTEKLQTESIIESVPRLKQLSVDGKILSTEGMLLADDVAMLETNIFNENSADLKLGKTNGTYLKKIIELLTFMDEEDRIGKHARYFRSKIASGMFTAYRLNESTYYHMFPEFFTNKKNINEITYKRGIKDIGRQIYANMIDWVYLWVMNKTPPTRKIEFGTSLDWSKHIESPSKTCKGLRVKEGVTYRGVEDIKNYDCKEDDFGDWICSAKTEPIPDEDLILCYDKENGFSCSSITDILYTLQESKNGVTPINHATGKAYEPEFLEKMMLRYGDLLKGKELPPRILTFEIDGRTYEEHMSITQKLNLVSELKLKTSAKVTIPIQNITKKAGAKTQRSLKNKTQSEPKNKTETPILKQLKNIDNGVGVHYIFDKTSFKIIDNVFELSLYRNEMASALAKMAKTLTIYIKKDEDVEGGFIVMFFEDDEYVEGPYMYTTEELSNKLEGVQTKMRPNAFPRARKTDKNIDIWDDDYGV